MKVKYDCFACLSRQTVTLAEKVTDDSAIQRKIIERGIRTLSETAFQNSTPKITADIFDLSTELSGEVDPYKYEKMRFNDIAEELIKKYKLKDIINKSDDPLETAIRLSIAGNIIDFSAKDNVDETDVVEAIETSLKTNVFGMDMNLFKELTQNATKIMLIGDNSGEIVFDKLLAEFFDSEKLTYVVKGGPIVNDATEEDAEYVQINKLARIITTGSAIQGADFEYCSQEFIDELNDSDVIICKGQANFETLDDYTNKPMFYLLQAKCIPVAKEIGCQKGDFVMMSNIR